MPRVPIPTPHCGYRVPPVRRVMSLWGRRRRCWWETAGGFETRPYEGWRGRRWARGQRVFGFQTNIVLRERPTKLYKVSADRGIPRIANEASDIAGRSERSKGKQNSPKQKNGALGGIRTHDLSLRRAALYPAELQARGTGICGVLVPRVRFELTRPYGHYVLNVARLPFRHPGTLPPFIHSKHTALRGWRRAASWYGYIASGMGCPDEASRAAGETLRWGPTVPTGRRQQRSARCDD